MKAFVVIVILIASLTGCTALKPIIDSMCNLDAVKKMSEEYTKVCEKPVEAPSEVPAEVPAQ